MSEPRDPEGFLKLFTGKKKRDLEKYSRDFVVYIRDFTAFIMCNWLRASYRAVPADNGK
jgi:hypothetical protein